MSELGYINDAARAFHGLPPKQSAAEKDFYSEEMPIILNPKQAASRITGISHDKFMEGCVLIQLDQAEKVDPDTLETIILEGVPAILKDIVDFFKLNDEELTSAYNQAQQRLMEECNIAEKHAD